MRHAATKHILITQAAHSGSRTAFSTVSAMQPQSSVLLDEQTLRNSVISSGLGALISLACCITLFRRAFAEQLGHQFITSDSAIQFMMRRCRLLFFASMLTFADAVRNLAQWIMIWESILPDLLLVRVVYLFTFVIALPLQTYATCQRCAVVVTRKPEQRTKFLRLTAWTCALSMVVVQGGILVRILELTQDGVGTTTQQWLDTTFVPNSVIAFTAMFPFVIMASSMWALSVNLSRERIKTKKRRTGDCAAVGQSGSLPSQSVSQFGSASIPPTESQSGASPSSHMALKSVRSRTYSTLANVSSAVLSVAVRKKRTVSSGTNSQHGQFMYPLSRTFIALSLILISLWIFALAASILEFLPSIRTNALNSALNATCIAVEASFEKLLRCAKQAHQKKENERVVDKTFGDVTEDVETELKHSKELSLNQVVDPVVPETVAC